MTLQSDYELDREIPFKSKKFIFKIYPEHIDYIEQMEIVQRNEFINQAIDNYLVEYDKWNKYEVLINKCKQIALYLLIIVLCIPVIILFFKIVTTETKNTNKQMEYNFEKVIDSYRKN